MTISVVKADGTRQLFEREKVVRTCVRMGATLETAERIADKIETKMHDGMETRKILKMIFNELSKYKPVARYGFDLRKALSLMYPKPDFERFVQILLGEQGYAVTPNQIVRGKCGEHEVDAIARKNGVTYIVEVKHHFNYHTPTGLDVGRIARAIIEDAQEGFELGLSKLKIDRALIVCNTKLSEHARNYAECRGIQHIGWSYPLNNDLQVAIEENKLYPVSCLRDLNSAIRNRLSFAGIILLKQLVSENPEKISITLGISKESAKLIIDRANAVLF